MEEQNYDPACERIDTAVKAIFLLYRRGRWEVLCRLFPQMKRREIEAAFERFDDRFIQSYGGKITTEKQVFALMRCFPPHSMTMAACKMVGRYQWMMQFERNQRRVS